MDLLRQIVGGPKNRYKDEKYNLDLTYITPRLIAMAFPASGIQKLIRNSIDEVQKFLTKHHGCHYMIMNLSNRQVNQKKLNNVYTYEWQDHQAPPIQMIFSVCQNATDYLNNNQNNVVVVHCNHGKGRTGTIICCMLIYGSVVKNSQIAIDFYAKKRFETQQGYGVTQPCQILYIKYFEQIINNPKIRPRVIAFTKIIFRGYTKFELLYIKIKTFNGKNILTTKKSQSKTIFQKKKNQNNIDQLILTSLTQQYCWGDIKIFIKSPSTLSTLSVGSYSLNTAFLSGNKHSVSVCQLSPYSLRKTDYFGKDFQFQLHYKSFCQCPSFIEYSQRCDLCKEKLFQEEVKWKKIEIVVEKRKQTTQRDRESMLGFHLQKVHKLGNIKQMQLSESLNANGKEIYSPFNYHRNQL